MEKKNIFNGRVLTHVNRHTPVCLMNPTNNPVVIRKGKMVGTFEPIYEYQKILNIEVETAVVKIYQNNYKFYLREVQNT